MRARYSLGGGRVHEQLVQAAEQRLVQVLVVTCLRDVGDDGRGLHLLQDNNDQAVSPQLCQHTLWAPEEDPIPPNAEPWIAKTGDPPRFVDTSDLRLGGRVGRIGSGIPLRAIRLVHDSQLRSRAFTPA
jgi:hypothetical protein